MKQLSAKEAGYAMQLNGYTFLYVRRRMSAIRCVPSLHGDFICCQRGRILCVCFIVELSLFICFFNGRNDF